MGMGSSASTPTTNHPTTRQTSEETMDHPMRDLLDDGSLTANSRDRKFTTFLDLKQEYHNEFITRLREHVQIYGYKWSELEQSKSERELCAGGFLNSWGKMYWGTETNRQKYLLQGSLDEPGCLCVYPDREKEIIDAIAILLLRKARGQLKAQQPKDSMEVNVTPSASNRPAQPSSAPQPTTRKETKKKRKKEERWSISPSPSDDQPRRPVAARKTTAADMAIRPFRSIASVETNDAGQSKANSQTKSQEPITTSPTTSPSPSTDTAMMTKTHFLVSIDNQQGMAPIYVPFKRFSSTAAFLSHMLSECTLQYWDDKAQRLSDVQPEQVQVVVAASVRLSWSSFDIRLRQGKDQDWALFMAHLEKAWKESELSMDGEFYDGFKILVMLHVAVVG